MLGDDDVIFIVAHADGGMRLDKFIQSRLPGHSRSFLAQQIRTRNVFVDEVAHKPGYRVRAGEKIHIVIPAPQPAEYRAEAIDLDRLHEDRDIIVINKPPGLVVHPAPGHATGTLVNALLHHCPDLAGIGGEIRPGIVHRLDKDTSGVMVVAKNAHAQECLADQFKQRCIRKTYFALAKGRFKSNQGIIDLPIGRHPVHRKKMSVRSRRSRDAETHWRVVIQYKAAAMLEIDLKTGRTHQIRVHLAAINHPILGDPIYGGRSTLRPKPEKGLHIKTPRQMLHAARLTLRHPVTGRQMSFEAPLPADMQQVVAQLSAFSNTTETGALKNSTLI